MTVFDHASADAWWLRNKAYVRGRKSDQVVEALARLNWPRGLANDLAIEIGCADGTRLHRLTTRRGGRGAGCDLSPAAIMDGSTAYSGLDLRIASGLAAPFASGSAGVVILGFFMTYLDPGDYFTAVQEADRLLADNGLLIVQDFLPNAPGARPYGHADQLTARKMEFSRLFLGHPHYRLVHRELVLDRDESLPHPDDRQGIDILHKDRAGAFAALEPYGGAR
jgi:SAM-dependent methyltransferase